MNFENARIRKNLLYTMSYLINNPIEAKNMGLLAHKYIFEKFSKKAVIKQLDNLYNEL